jgi:MYXO-CTERM domain-containing protein
MTNRKLTVAMFAVTGLLPVAANADVRAPVVTKMIASSPTDFAPITQVSGTTPGRLRRTDQEQPGNEMAHFAMFGDGTSGLLFSMNTDLVDPANPSVSHTPQHKIQLAMVPFKLVKNPDGTVGAQPDFTGVGTNTEATGGARFVTTNQGNEHRNANHPIAYAIAGGNAICAEYNYQPGLLQGGIGDTIRYMQCFNKSGATIMKQTELYHKIGDDCSMNEDKGSTWAASTTGNATRLVAWRGCNGNGLDDGWAQTFDVTVDNPANPTTATLKKIADVSLCPREERSRGYCTTGTDSSTAICTWTEGNTQPQRDGTWMAAIDISGNNAGQKSIYWKQQIDGKKTMTVPDTNSQSGTRTIRTYSMRATHDRIQLPDATGTLQRTDMIVFRAGDVQGNNNGNGKGGTYFANNMAIIKADKTGMQYVMPMTNMTTTLNPMIDGTHLGFTAGVFGTTDNLKPGIVFLQGSHTGGGTGTMAQVVTWDQTANKLVGDKSFNTAPFDRHLYPNYLGNNPGNQGRNFSGAEVVKNPFATNAAGEDAYLLITSTTGKPDDEQPSATCLDCAKKKLAAYLTVVSVAQTPAVAAPTGSGSTPPAQNPPTQDPSMPAGSQDSSTQLGGCSTSNGTSGAITFALIGLAAFTRRRRR